jgi:hypothetical protein
MGRRAIILTLSLGVVVIACSGQKREITAETTGREGVMVQPAFTDEALQEKIGRYTKVRIPYDPSIFSEKEQKAVEQLYKAARIMDDLFWEQASHRAPTAATVEEPPEPVRAVAGPLPGYQLRSLRPAG